MKTDYLEIVSAPATYDKQRTLNFVNERHAEGFRGLPQHHGQKLRDLSRDVTSVQPGRAISILHVMSIIVAEGRVEGVKVTFVKLMQLKETTRLRYHFLIDEINNARTHWNIFAMIELPDLDEFDVSPSLGFLSNHPPLPSFSTPHFAQLDELAASLPILITTQSLRQRLDSLPYLDPIHLSSETNYRRAYVVLGFLIHAYVWGGPKDNVPHGVIPPQLAEPFLAACERLGMEPVLSYAGLCLWNWAAKDGAVSSADCFFELDELRPLCSFTGSVGEAAFYHIPVLIEAEGGPLIPLLLRAVAAIERGDTDQVIKVLIRSAETIGRMKQHLPKLYATLDSGMFYHELRPFLSGGKDMEDKGLSRGFVFQRSDGSEQEVKCIGGSAAQSSLFQFLDIVLGVQHEPMGRSSETIFQAMRAYMPGKHRQFLETVSALPSIRPYVQQNATNTALHNAYDECIKQLRQWRSSHIAVVSKYIVRPARLSMNVNQDAAADNIDQASLEIDNATSLQGTGGSSLIPFLRQSRDETTGI